MKKLQTLITHLPLAFAQLAFAGTDKTGINHTDVKLQIDRIQGQESASFDDAVELLKLRANQHKGDL